MNMKKIQADIVTKCLNDLIPNNTVYLPYMKFLTSYIENLTKRSMEELSKTEVKQFLLEGTNLLPFKTTYGKFPVEYLISDIMFEEDQDLISDLEVRPKDSTIDDTFIIGINVAFDNFRIELPIKPIEYVSEA